MLIVPLGYVSDFLTDLTRVTWFEVSKRTQFIALSDRDM